MRRRWTWILGTVVAVVIVAVAASFLLEEPLRRQTERQMNARLKGYTAHIGHVTFQPIGFSMDFRDVILAQDAHPDPPVLRVKLLHASLQWSALLHGRVVADFLLDQPVVYVDHTHFVAELNDPTPVKDHGWQDALQAMYPAKINLFRIRDGAVTYVDTGQSRPLTLRALNASARNIRNVRSEKGVYPSPLNVDAVVFDNGRLTVDGAADFLRAPYAGFKGRVELDRIALDYFKPIARRYGFAIARGTFGGRGDVEYSPDIALVDLQEIRVDGLQGDYAYHPKTAAPVEKAARTTAQAAQKASNANDVILRARKVLVNDATVGFINDNADPHYRVFLAGTNLTIDNFTNQKSEGMGTLKLTGRLQGTGQTTAILNMRAENHGPDFDLNVRVDDVGLPSMNDLLLATAKFDVAAGELSVYSQATVKNGRVDGYVKPLFKDLKVYEKDKDQDKTFGQKVKEKAIDVAGKLLKNRPRKEVATVVPISGPIDNPKAGTWPTLVGLLRNAFFKAILPGFEREREMVASTRS